MKQRPRKRHIKRIEVNAQFSKIRNKKKLTAWLMRQYFDADINAKSPWFKRSVTEKTVLLYVSDPLNRFPLTPAKITDMFNCIQSFKKHLKKSEKELGPDLGLSKADVADLNKPVTAKYQTGEVTLQKIGKVLGGLTPTMINKLATSGMDRVRRMTNGVPLDELHGERVDDLNRFIMDCRINAALEYADELLEAKGNVKKFIAALVKKRVMTINDVKIMEDREIESILDLTAKSQGEIVQALMADINRDSNIFKTYQSAVSRKAFPEKKRGRPRKVDVQQEQQQQRV